MSNDDVLRVADGRKVVINTLIVTCTNATFETQVLASMASLPEDKKLAEVEQQLEEEVEKLEEKVNMCM